MSSEMERIAGAIQRLSAWIDTSPANAARDPEALTWGRIAKCAEEAGEAVQNFVGVTNQNPRKGVYSTREDVMKELLDLAVTGLSAWEHMDGNEGRCMIALGNHAQYLDERAEEFR